MQKYLRTGDEPSKDSIELWEMTLKGLVENLENAE
jgi:hypothetical protein